MKLLFLENASYLPVNYDYLDYVWDDYKNHHDIWLIYLET